MNLTQRLGFVRMTEGAMVPKYQTEGAAAFDLHADFSNRHINAQAYGIEVTPRQPIVFDTGLMPVIPAGYVLLIFSRSGHGFKSDIRLANCVGVIDSDYQGTIGVKLTADPAAGFFRVHHGDRIAQAILMPAPQADIHEANIDDVVATKRGANGFGSTGNQ
ncbi:deoxyuridine 5'-triphosphate nucleotidohydrolase [Pseudomonas phage PspYZU01]|uniref:dUTP diphosphatase n=1 Tax=Pseudomonas phage PspYZU01 TaxID=1983555 RepID=A0A2U7NRV0_9CAUD|nr:deoxyuridine 5'-triphosphate nucleotidohydrolase [Pseudomonas phage PspYZU01]ASD51902.1 deoxyuridine 5'-triphosphate nucleotidohydrolase [Pseudomonas phage PspYZU01]